MDRELAAADTGGGTADTSSSHSSGGDDFTPAEKAYFQSRGSDVTGLGADAPPASATSTGTSTTADAPGVEVEATPGEFDPEDVTIDDKGRARTKDGKYVKTVPHSVFHKMNERRKEAERAAAASDAKFARADERLTILNGAIAEPQRDPVTNALIDPKADIFGALEQERNARIALEARLAALDSKHDTIRNETASYNEFRDDVVKFVKTTPDFGDAFEYLSQSRHNELQLAGITDAAKRTEMIGRDARALVAQARKEGKDPVARIYEVAKARGFASKAAAAPVTDLTKGAAADAINRTNAGQAANVSLGAGSGTASDKIGLAELADMPEPEFERHRAAVVAKYGAPYWARVMRGEVKI